MGLWGCGCGVVACVKGAVPVWERGCVGQRHLDAAVVEDVLLEDDLHGVLLPRVLLPHQNHLRPRTNINTQKH